MFLLLFLLQMIVVGSVLLGFVLGFYIFRHFSQRTLQMGGNSRARERAQQKRRARDERREELLKLLRQKANEHLTDRALADRIAQSTVTELLNGLETKQFTHTQVVLVFSLRSLKIGQAINATTEEFFDQALKQAEAFDAQDSTDRQGLLRGIPVSIKDQINQQGADSSMGLAMRNFRPSTKDSLLVQLLKEQGALAGFVRSATLQGMMLPASESETYGVAANPFDTTRTTGGSSGGEGALIAARGSPVGIGTDIGGSIRIPAHFNGIFGFKPTPGRLTNQGIRAPRLNDELGETNIRATAGPLARSADDLVLVMRALLQETMWLNDPNLARQPWREERFQEKKRLTIGYYTDDQWFTPSPACIRAVNEAAEALRRLGHHVVPYAPVDVREGIRLFVAIVQADGNRHFLNSLEGEKVHPLYDALLLNSRLPAFARPLIARILRAMGEDRTALLVEAVRSRSTYEYFELVTELKRYSQRWLDDWRENHIDLLLTPVNGLPAYRHGQAGHLFHSCSYTFLFNVLHVPAGVVPVTTVRDDEQYYKDEGSHHRERIISMAQEACRESAGLPIGVQLIGWPNDDERVLRVMKELEEAIGKSPIPMPKIAADVDIFVD